jgi:hypothetical protein
LLAQLLQERERGNDPLHSLGKDPRGLDLFLCRCLRRAGSAKCVLEGVSRSVVLSLRLDDLGQPISEPGLDHRQLVLPPSRFGFGALSVLCLDRCGVLITLQRGLGIENLLDLFVEQGGQSLGLAGAERSRARRADWLLRPLAQIARHPHRVFSGLSEYRELLPGGNTGFPSSSGGFLRGGNRGARLPGSDERLFA